MIIESFLPDLFRGRCLMNYIAMQIVSFCIVFWENPKDSNTVGVINMNTQGGWLPAIFGQKYLLNILVVAVLTTVGCLLLAYPVAYILAKGAYVKKHTFLMLFVLPMWINFTLRITALKEILTLLEGNLALHPFLNTIICMIYDFLPFMILPLYNSLSKLDNSLMEAAADLGAKNSQVFLRMVLPLSVPGIISGITMVFLPSMTNYVVLDMVYNSTYIIGSLIGSYFSSYDWHNGSVVSIILLLIICAITWVSNRFAGGEQERKAGVSF